MSTATAATTSLRARATTTACSGSNRARTATGRAARLMRSWSQAHASTLVDLNGDGRLDIVTGKRFMAHNGSDPGEKEPLGVYWYEFARPTASAIARRRRRSRRVDQTCHRLWRPHGRGNADPGDRYRRRRRSRYSLCRQERALLRREPDKRQTLGLEATR